jgi:dihydrofolate synthase/folylpolyglutamate synthase
MDLLGDTLPLIAKEKAGIIKYKIPVVISERSDEADEVFLFKAEAEESQLVFAEDVYTIVSKNEKLISNFDILWNHEPFLTIENFSLGGLYQTKNIAGVLMACEILNESGFIIEKQKIADGLQNVVTNTGLKGRWQILQRDPFIVCDTGHNLNGIEYVLEQIKRTPHKNLHIVWGMVKDKDHDKILTLLPKHAHYYFCKANIPRAELATLLAEKASKFGLKGEVIEDVNNAIEKAKQTAQKDDMIFIGGSTFVVAEINNL